MASTRSAGTTRGGVQAAFSLKPAAVAVAVALSLGGGARLALANPTGPTVVNGQVTMNQAGSLLSITNSPNSIINWQSFSIGANEITRFTQQSAASAILNRVVGAGGSIDPSVILGALQSNGRVFLINPAGIVFGAGSQIDVAGLVASSLNLSNADFLGGRLRFTEVQGAGSVVNQGAINAATGGQVYLVGASVTNSGLITSPKGEVILAAGNSVELVNPGTPNLRVEITAPNNEARNLGSIVADAGRVGIYAGLINQSGTIRADSAIATDDGRIILKATKNVDLGATSITTANGPTGGRIEINAGDTALVAGTVEAKGASGQGGVVHVLGDKVGIYGNARVDVSGETHGGTVLAGGEFQGRAGVSVVEGAAIRNASFTFFGSDAAISADAIASGDGGKVILWSDDTTRSHGAISARGGAASGNGGFVETSGKGVLDVTRGPDLRAPHGLGGTWLLDPNDLVVDFGFALVNNTAQPMFSTLGESSFVGVDLINLQLDAGSSVLLTTTSQGPANGAQQGNITIKAPIIKSASSTPGSVIDTTNLVIRAHNNIIIESTGGIAATESIGPLGTPVQADRLNVTLTADIDGTGGGGVTLGGGIATKGGTVSISGRDLVAINAPINTTRAGSNAGSVTLNSANGGVSVAAPVSGAAFSATAQGAGATVGISAPVNATDVTLNSTAGGVSVGGAVNATSSFSATAGGAGANLAVSAPVSAASATLTADTMDIQAPVTAGAGGIVVRQSAPTRPMNLGTKVAGALSLTQSELSNLVTMGPVTFGNFQTGAFTIAAPITAGSSSVTINSGTSFNVSPGASLTTLVPLFVTAPATVIDGNINAQRASFTTSSMAVTALVASGTDIDIFSGSAVVNLGDGTFDGLHLTQSELNNLSAGTLRIGTNSSLTIQESITRAGTLSLFGSSGITAQPGKGITATSLALDTTGSATLNGPNAVGTLAARVPGDLSFSNSGPLTIGTVDTFAGLRGFFPSSSSNSITLAADNLNVSAPIRASSVTLMPMNPTSVRLDLGGADVAGTTLGITDGELDQIFATKVLFKADRADISAPITATMTELAIAPASASRPLNVVADGTKNPTSGALEITQADISNVSVNSFTLGDSSATSGAVNVNSPILVPGTITTFTLMSGDPAGITVGQAVSAGSNSIVLAADELISLGAAVSSLTGNVTVRTNIADRPINLGSDPGALILGVVGADNLSAPGGTLFIGGDLATGNITTGGGGVFFESVGMLDIKTFGTLAIADGHGLSTSGAAVFSVGNMEVEDGVHAGGNIFIAPRAFQNVSLGGGGSGLHLDNAELGNLHPGGGGSSGMLTIGNTTSTGSIMITGPISLPGGEGNVNTLSLITNFGSVSGSAIAVPNLAVRASSGITLTGDNDVTGELALQSGFGNVEFKHAGSGPLTIGTVDGVTGVSTQNFGFDTITLRADDLNINQPISANSGNGSVVIVPVSVGQQVALGTEPESTLGLTDAEIGRITAGNLAIGDTNTGNITVTGAMTINSIGSLSLTNAGTSTIQVNQPLTAVGDLRFQGGTLNVATGANVTSNGSIDLIANSMSIGAPMNALNGNLTLQPLAANVPILFGPGAVPGGVHIDDGEIGNLNYGSSLFIGNSSAGAVTVSHVGVLPGGVNIASGSGVHFTNTRGNFGASGDLSVTAGTMTIPGDGIQAGGTVAVRTNGEDILLGTTNGGLSLSTGELAKITAPRLLFDTSGSLTVGADLAFTQVTDLELSAGILNIDGGTLALPGTAILRGDDFNITKSVTSGDPMNSGRIIVASRNFFTTLNAGTTLSQAEIDFLNPSGGVLQLGDFNTSFVNIAAPIAQPSGAGALAIVAANGIDQAAGSPITASQLRVESNDDINLTQNNLVGTVAGTSWFGNLFVTNAQPLAVGAVDGASGLSADNRVTLKADGLSIQAGISASEVFLAPRVADSSMTLGVNPGGSQFGISQSELDLINGFSLTFGDSTTGPATVNAALTREFGTLGIITKNTHTTSINSALTAEHGVNVESGTINVSAPVTAPSGSIGLNALSTATLNVNSTLTAGGSVFLESAGAANINGAVTAQGGVFMNTGILGINAPVFAKFNEVSILSPSVTINAPVTSEFFRVVITGGTGSSVNVMAPVTAASEVRITADTLNVGATINATGSSVVLQPASNARAVNIGTEEANTFSLTAAELAFIGPDVDFLTLGSSSAGPMTISDKISSSTLSGLILRSGGSIVQTPDAAIQLLKTIPSQFGPVKVGSLSAFSGGSVDLRAANVVPGSLDGSIATSGTFDFNNTLPMRRDVVSNNLVNVLLSAQLNPLVAQKVRITSAPFAPLPVPPQPAAPPLPPQTDPQFQAQLIAAIDKLSDINDALDANSEEDKKKAEEEKKKQQECK